MLVQSTGALTILYPGTDSSHWDVIDLLQVILYVVLGHSVQKYPRRWRGEKHTDKGGREKERERGKIRGYVRHPALVFVWGKAWF